MAVPALNIKEGFQLVSLESLAYPQACGFVAEQYRRRLGCELTQFYPTIACLFEADEIVAAAGLRYGGDDSFFLEQYLEQPVDQVVGDAREALVEIGGFAALDKLKALLLMQHVAEYLDSISVRHVVCTANRPIRGCLRKLGIRFREIGFANPELLEADQDSWGSYYETAPLVLTGEVRVGVEAIRQLMACFS